MKPLLAASCVLVLFPVEAFQPILPLHRSVLNTLTFQRRTARVGDLVSGSVFQYFPLYAVFEPPSSTTSNVTENVAFLMEPDSCSNIEVAGLDAPISIDQNGTDGGLDLGKEIFLSTLEENANLVETTFETKSTAFEVSRLLDSTEDRMVEMPNVQSESIVTKAAVAVIAASEETLERSSSPMEDLDVKPTIVPATEVVGEPATAVTAPSVGKILKFAVPAIGVWLCGPLLSLIDTCSVGLLSGTAHQAALNPAVAVTDYAALLIAFLYTGTTNLIAATRESTDEETTRQTFVGALQLSAMVGAGLGALLYFGASGLLKAIIGNDAISPAVFTAALKYARIRALGMPAAAVIGSAQAGCLGMQDINGPLYVLGVAAVVNFLGDMLFVGNSHPLIGGAPGAAWATVFSQYAAVTMFLHWLTNGGSSGEQWKSWRRRKSKNSDKVAPPPAQNFSVRGFLQDKLRPLDLFRPAPRQTLKDFAEYVVPVTTTQVGRVSGYVAMSHVVASSLGTTSMAAQQIIVSLFYCLCPIADSLCLTAQSFLPALWGKDPGPDRTLALRKTSLNFVKAAGIFGAVMATVVSTIPLLSKCFTSDSQVVALVNSVAPLLVAFFSVHGIVCAMEGILLGRKDLGFLGKMYAIFFAVVPLCMLQVKRAALQGLPAQLKWVWRIFLGYQFARAGIWSFRVGQLQWRTESKNNLRKGFHKVGDRP